MQEALASVARHIGDIASSLTGEAQEAAEEVKRSFISVACPYISKCFMKLYSDNGPGLQLEALTET